MRQIRNVGWLSLALLAGTRWPDDTNARAAAAQALAFEQAVQAKRWADALDFVWPAKITTRFIPPFDTWQWSPPTPPPCTGRDVVRVTAVVADTRWARVRIATCTAERELWLLQLDGRWKILRRIDVPISSATARTPPH